jgi:hypothetical protein
MQRALFFISFANFRKQLRIRVILSLSLSRLSVRMKQFGCRWKDFC